MSLYLTAEHVEGTEGGRYGEAEDLGLERLVVLGTSLQHSLSF